jgi:hypothetical protein
VLPEPTQTGPKKKKKKKKKKKTISDSVNNTRLPKEDHQPDCISRDNQVKKDDHVGLFVFQFCPLLFYTLHPNTT